MEENKMNIDDFKRYQIEDKSKILEAQKETIESFKQYFGNYEVIFETIEELDKKFNAFFQWRNKEWIVPGKGKTPEQLWEEAGNPSIELPKMDFKKNFNKKTEKIGVIADPIFGIVLVPFYGYLKEFFEGDYKKIPDCWGFFEHMIMASGNIPSFVIKNMILKNKENAIKLFQHEYKKVKDIEDIFHILEKNRKDWNDSPELWNKLIDSEKAGTIKSNPVSKEQLDDFKISAKEFDMAWEEYFRDKPEPKNDEEDRKQQEDFHYWYNNVRKQTDTGKTPAEMRSRIMDFDWDEDYDEYLDEFNEYEKGKSLGMVPWEVSLIEKISLITELSFHGEEEKAVDKYKESCSEEILTMASEVDFQRGFHAWFLTEHKLPNGKTPFENVFSREDLNKLFSKREIKMIENFLAFKQSLFEIKAISQNKKDYTLQNILDNQEYLVKTIDFPAKLKIGDFVIACLVQKLDKNYFFYGNVLTYGKKEGLRLKKTFFEEFRKLQK